MRHSRGLMVRSRPMLKVLPALFAVALIALAAACGTTGEVPPEVPPQPRPSSSANQPQPPTPSVDQPDVGVTPPDGPPPLDPGGQ